MMVNQRGIPANQLSPDTQRALGIDNKLVQDRYVVLGKILQELEGMTRADALWTLRKAIKTLGGK